MNRTYRRNWTIYYSKISIKVIYRCYLARKIYLFLNNISTELFKSEEKLFYLEKKLVTLTNDNIGLKEALAEMEVKFRKNND